MNAEGRIASRPLSRPGLIGYALGAAGWSALDRLIVSFALFFYLPPAGAGLPVRIADRVVFGLTVFGAVMLLGRVVDSVADPLVASWSDRSRAPAGRRRVFLAWGMAPLGAAAAAIFFPPAPAPSAVNAIYLALLLAAFFFLFTVYVVPYLALIPALAPDPDGRIHLTTLQAYATLLGAALVLIATPLMIGAFGGGVAGHQSAILITCAIAVALLALPVLAVDERRLAPPSDQRPAGLAESLRLTLQNRPFLWYLGGNIAYWFAFNIVSTGALYYTTVLMRAEEAFQGAALAATFAVAAVFFAVWNVLGRKLGKRRALLIAGAAFVASMTLFAFVKSAVSGIAAFALAGVPVAALLVLPNAALADCIDLDSRLTGTRREAMYFGAQGFLLKVNLGLSSAVFAALMGAFGRDPGHDLGVRLSGPVAALVVLAGMWCFWRYPERS